MSSAKDKLTYYLSKTKSSPESPENYLAAARIYDEQKDYTEALKYYEASLNMNYKGAEVNLNIGFIHALKNDIEEALKYWEKAYSLNPKLSHIINDNSKFYNKRTGLVENHLKEEIGSNTENSHLYYNLGIFQFYFKTPAIALSSFIKAQELNPKLVESYLLCGEIFTIINKNNHAVLQLKKALAMDPSLYKAHYNLGKIYEKENNFPLAQAQFEKAVSCNDKAYEVYQALGRIFAKQNDPDRAITNLQKSIDLLPHNPQTHFDLAKCFETINKIELAEQHYKKAIELNPGHEAAYYNLAVIYKQAGQTEKAIESFGSLLKIEPSNPYANYQLGIIYLHEEKYEEAVEYLNKSAENNPTDVYTLYNLGVAYYKTGKFTEAIDRLNLAVNINSEKPEYYNMLGEAYARTNKYEEAYQSFLKYINLNPDNHDILFNLGILSIQIKNYKEALEYFEKLLSITPDLTNYYHGAVSGYYLKNREKTELYLSQSLNLDNNNCAVNHIAGCLEAEQNNNYEKAEELFNNSLKSNPEFFNALRDLTFILIKTGRNDEAQDLLRKASVYTGSSLENILSLAVLFARTGRINKSLSVIEKALETDKESSLLFGVWGYIYQLGSDSASAVKCYEKAYNINPEFTEVKEAKQSPNFINQLFFRPYIGHIHEAIELKEETDPSAQGYFEEIDEDQTEISRKLLDEYLNEEKELNSASKTILKLADTYINIKKYDLACVELEKLINDSIKNKEIILKYASCKNKLSKYEDAVNILEKAVKIYNEKEIFINLINNLSKIKDNEKLKSYSEKILVEFDLTDREKSRLEKYVK
ncbi:MAG: tetratricopeptide repeat protein [Armatimonadota bacterium]